jgi:hypothetical protein
MKTKMGACNTLSLEAQTEAEGAHRTGRIERGRIELPGGAERKRGGGGVGWHTTRLASRFHIFLTTDT